MGNNNNNNNNNNLLDTSVEAIDTGNKKEMKHTVQVKLKVMPTTVPR